MSLGFKTRIYVSVALLITLSLAVLGGLNLVTLKGKMVTALQSQTLEKLDYHVNELRYWVDSRYQAVQKGSAQFGSHLSGEENQKLVNLLADSAQLSNVIMAYDDGRSFMSLEPEGGKASTDFTGRPWYQDTRQSMKASITDIYTDRITGLPVVSVVSPVTDQGRFVGVLLGDISLAEVITQVSNMRFAGGAATLTDRNNVFFASDDPTDIGKTPSQVSPTFTEMERAFGNQLSGHLEFPYLGIQFDGYFKRVELSPDIHWTLMVFVDQSTALAGVFAAQSNAIMTGLGLLVASMVVMVFMLNHIYKPLLRLKYAVLDLADGTGDLTRRLKVEGDDDLAQIGEGFNHFAANLQQMMLHIVDASQSISSSIEQMSLTARENERMLLSHSSETDQVVTSITEMSESSRSVAESVVQSNQVTEGASHEMQQSMVNVENAVTTVNSLVSDVELMSEQIVAMNQNALRIGEVLSVIGAISEQTNLLALNAAIEAARAGEQGRGFAVVADEVRALAGRTQDSTSDISEMLSKLLEGTDAVVSSMENTKAQCQLTAEKTQDVSGSLEVMSGSVVQIDDLSSQIATATEEQSSVAEEITRNMLAIRDIVESLVQSGQETVSATESLASCNTELDRLVSNFKLR